MQRRRLLGGLVAVGATVAGCTSQDDPAGPSQSETDSTSVPGWDGETLDTAVLLDAHVATLTGVGAFTYRVTASGTRNGSVELVFRVNTDQGRLRGDGSFSARPDRSVYANASKRFTRKTEDDGGYSTAEMTRPISESTATFAEYSNDDFEISFVESLQAFEYDHIDTDTQGDRSLFQFESTGGTAADHERASIRVDDRGVIRAAEFTAGETTVRHEYTAVGETDVAIPAWLTDATPMDTDTNTDTDGEPTSDDPPTPTGATDVAISADAFSPTELEVSVGETVTWTNRSARTHTVTLYEQTRPNDAAYFASGGFESEQAAREAWRTDRAGGLTDGETFSHTFETTGTYEYCCLPHERAGMTGSITVTDS